MFLNTYSGKDLQTITSFLEQAISSNENISAKDCLALIQKAISDLTKNYEDMEHPKESKYLLCPSCQKGYLTKTINPEDLNILSCKQCRYSFIKE
jgi:20S proteasome alpha/beta subunit